MALYRCYFVRHLFCVRSAIILLCIVRIRKSIVGPGKNQAFLAFSYSLNLKKSIKGYPLCSRRALQVPWERMRVYGRRTPDAVREDK